MKYTSRHRVYFKDTDAGGVMYHSRYVEFLEMARTELFHHLGYSVRKILDELNIVFPIYDISVRYYRPAYLDDLLSVELAVTQVKGAKISFAYTIRNQHDDLLSEARSENAVVDVRKMKPVRIDTLPSDLIENLKNFN